MSGRIVCVLGDPASIGPEVGFKGIETFFKKNLNAAQSFQLSLIHPFINLPQSLQTFESKGLIECIRFGKGLAYTPGRPSRAQSLSAFECLEFATDECLSGKAQALVTGPLDKSKIAEVKPGFLGHTEYLKQRSKAKAVTMLLAGKELRVSLVTTHLALKEVPKRITKKEILRAATQTSEFLKSLHLSPRLGILGLNPHASDGGLFGDEEKRQIEPAIRELQKRGILAEGPLSADTAFVDAERKYGAVIAMYHDQGLIPLKMKHFYDAVNITLGLPFLRTSVDHGTAFQIAGKGIASSESYEHALQTAYDYLLLSRSVAKPAKRSSYSNSRRERA